MDAHREKLIEARAYELWEQEGRPDGEHERHWHQAIRDVELAEAKRPSRARAKAAALKSTAAKATAVKSTAKTPRARAKKAEQAKS